jgi:hypothetical protein
MVPAFTYCTERAASTAVCPMRRRSFSPTTVDGASSMIFWWRRWMEHSRSPRCTTLPLASAMIWISMWRGASTYFST